MSADARDRNEADGLPPPREVIKMRDMHPPAFRSHPVIGIVAGTPVVATIEQLHPADLTLLLLTVNSVRTA